MKITVEHHDEKVSIERENDDINFSEFIDWVNENDVEIINSYITYHKYDYSHIPRYINYVIKIKRK